MRSSFLCLALLAGCGGTVTESVDASSDTTTDATSDLGASDAATDTAIDTRAACIDDAGTVPVDVKLCGSTTECAIRTRMVDCCGSIVAVGVRADKAAAFAACEAERQKGIPPCDCIPKPTTAEDGKVLPDGGTASVLCSDRTGESGLCRTFVP